MLGLVLQASAQIRDQILVTAHDQSPHNPHLLRFDRHLAYLGSTLIGGETQGSLDEHTTAVVVAPDGRIWMPIDALNAKKLVRLEPDGTLLLPSYLLGDYPVSLTGSASGVMYALTRVPLTIPAPAYAVDGAGQILWSNDTGPKQFGFFPPQAMAVTVDGRLWIGNLTEGTCGCQLMHGLMMRLDTATGAPLQQVHTSPVPAVPSSITRVSAAPDGGVWAAGGAIGIGPYLLRIDETGVVQQFPVLSVTNSVTWELRVDAAGDLWAVSNFGVANGGLLRKYSRFDGQLLQEIDMQGAIGGFALGAGGEDMFAVTGSATPPFYRLVRVNLVTERLSARSLDPFTSAGIGPGDPSGFIFANVVDQAGDADGDGATNRAETLAGSSPYDASSRPEGPKVYLDFTASNAIILTFKDPDGLLHATGGLDVGSIEVDAGAYGNIFPLLLSFLTFVQVTPDLTEATAVFGGLSLPSDLKLPLDVRVSDLSGAVGWDWQVTPPGEL